MSMIMIFSRNCTTLLEDRVGVKSCLDRLPSAFSGLEYLLVKMNLTTCRQFFIQMICGLLNDLSVIMMLAMISVSVPGVANMIQSIILNIIYLDMLYTSEWLIPFFQNRNLDTEGNLMLDQSRNIYLENSGFSSQLVLLNLGSTLLFLAILFSLYLIYWLLKCAEIFWPR